MLALPRSLCRVLAAVCLLLAAGSGQAALDASANTDDHSINTPTAWWTYTDISPADLADRLSENNARLVEMEVVSVTAGGEPRFVVRMVANSGAYAVPGWWWYYDKTAADLTTLLNANNGRLVEIERYDRGGGNIRYAVVMLPNSGSLARGWTYLLGVTGAQLASHIGSSAMRPIDLDTYGSGAGLRYDAVFVSNSGADYRTFQWAGNQTAADVTASVGSFQGRVVKLDRQEDGRYSFVQVRVSGSNATAWWYRYGFTSLSAVNNYALQFAARPVDVSVYSVAGTRYYDAAFIDNANASTRRIRSAFAPFVTSASQTPRGIFEAYLKRVDGAVVVNLNGTRRAETASALKSLHLLHEMKQVEAGTTFLGEAFYYYNYPPFDSTAPEAVCPNPLHETAANRVASLLEPSMDQMMEISDNRIARAVVIRAGSSFAPLNTTAANAGMTGTTLRHNIGCAYINPISGIYSPSTLRNTTTAADLAHLYEGVWNRALISSTHSAREKFLESANPRTGAWAGLQTIIDQEAAALGKASIAGQFGGIVKRWSKGGGYGTCLGLAGNPAECGQKVLVYSYTGLIAFPARNRVGQIALRYYSHGSLVSDVPVANWSSTEQENYAKAYGSARDELFRDEIRAALATW